MRARLTVILTLLSLVCALQARASLVLPVQSFATLPHQYLDNKARGIHESFEKRASLFLKGKNFQPWRANKPKADILKEFDQINEWRIHAWYVNPTSKTLIAREDFMIAQDLLEKSFYRQPNIIAFQYNQTDATYNSSTIVLNGFKFLALEAPSAQSLKHFFTLLQNHRVTQLVRLTVAKEKGVEKSYAYWNGKLKRDAKKQETILNVPQPFNPAPYPIRYYYTDNWIDHQGFNPQELLNLIQSTRKSYDPSTDLLACHCSAGVGRTGTFLAGFLLLTEIDRQLASGVAKKSLNISIEKIVMQLSLQRPYMVAKPEQYVTLHRLVDLYVQNLK